MLGDRAISDATGPSKVRGCAPTRSLAKDLPFQSRYANEENVRQVVRRLRGVLGEIGVDMTKFPTAGSIRSWARLCPRNDESAGKILSRRTLKGANWIKTLMIQVAWTAVRTKDSYFRAQFLRLSRTAGKKKAIVAVAASILTVVYHMIRNGSAYKDLGGNYFDRRNRDQAARRLVTRLQRLGYNVQVTEAVA